MEELEKDIEGIAQKMSGIFQIISCNFTPLPTTHLYADLDQLAARKRLKEFALQLEKAYASNL